MEGVDEIEELLADRAEWMRAYEHAAKILRNVAILLEKHELGAMTPGECAEAVKAVLGDEPD